MRIDAYNQIAQLYGVSRTTKTAKTQSASRMSDQVSISQAGRDYQIAKKAVSEASDIREDKVALLKNMVDSGQYEVSGDDFASVIPSLEALTDLDQQAGDELLIMSNKQVSLLTDIANVLGKSDEKMTVTRLIGYLGTQPDIQAKRTAARDSLIEAAAQMKEINDLNSQLLAQAIELTEFDITLFKSMKQAPETANYDRNAYNTGDILGSSGFDAKQ